jgi:hypothetical protein
VRRKRTSFSRVDERSESSKRTELGDDCTESSSGASSAKREQGIDRGRGDDQGRTMRRPFVCDEVNLCFQRFEDKGSLQGLMNGSLK